MTKEEILARLRELSEIQRECEVMVNGSTSPFWEILGRTIRAQKTVYLHDSYAAAEDNDKAIRNFLGKMESLDWLLDLVEKDFLEQAKRAHDEKISLENQLREAERLDADVNNTIEGPMLQPPGLI